MTKPITSHGWTLQDEAGQPVMIGQTVTFSDGTTTTLGGGREPRGPGKSGYVWPTEGGEYYPHVFKLRWVSPEGRYFGDGL